MKILVFLSSLLAVSLAVRSGQLDPLTSTRVSDGLNALPGAAPYACSIRWGITNRSHACGAILLTESFFLSAAHCFIMPPGEMDIQCGVTNRIADLGTQQIRVWSPNEMVYHPGWNGNIYSDDIVIVQISEPFTLNTWVQTVRLRTAEYLDHETDGRLFGWGAPNGTTESPPVVEDILQTAEMDVYNAETCRERMAAIQTGGMERFVTDDNICASRGTYSVCHGDAGSPLVRHENGSDVLIGMAVWGLGPCGRLNSPSVFRRISAYTSWFEQRIGDTLS